MTLTQAARDLSRAVDALSFAAPVAYTYNPLAYAWAAHEAFLARYGAGRRKVLFLGMNPGPWGMAQVGIPFGEVGAVRDWLGLHALIQPPARMHPKRPVEGFACRRSEVSGRRLWEWFAARFGTPEAFFRDHFVANYCPLLFLEASGRNRTPDQLPAAERAPLEAACDAHLRNVAEILRPEWVVGVGTFARRCAARVLAGSDIRVTTILHPSPASPAANRGWAPQATRAMQEAGIWDVAPAPAKPPDDLTGKRPRGSLRGTA